MCFSKPHIPDPPPAPIIQNTEKNVELAGDTGKKSAQQKAGRAGTRSLQIAVGGKSKASGLKIPS